MDWSAVTSVLEHVLDALPSFFTVVIVLVLSHSLFLKSSGFGGDGELIGSRNAAVGLVFGAYLLGVTIGLGGVFFGEHHTASWETSGSLPVRMGKVAVESIFVVVLLRLSIWVNDRFILRHFSIVREIKEDRNMGAAFCVAGSAVAGGLILNGALCGYSSSFVTGLRDLVLFWFLGQVVLVGGGLVYERMARYDLHRLIEYDDNAAVGVGFGGFLVALAIVGRAALVGAGSGPLASELLQTSVLAILGVTGLMVVRPTVGRLMMPKADYREDVEMGANMAVSIVAAIVTIGVALLVGAAIQRGIQ